MLHPPVLETLPTMTALMVAALIALVIGIMAVAVDDLKVLLLCGVAGGAIVVVSFACGWGIICVRGVP